MVEKYDIIQSKCWKQQQHPARERDQRLMEASTDEAHKEMLHGSKEVLTQVHTITFATSLNEHTQLSCVNWPIPLPREK